MCGRGGGGGRGSFEGKGDDPVDGGDSPPPARQVYKRVLDKPKTEVRTAGVCMRENDFYVGTVRDFRDRRYEYKGLNKVGC